MIVGAAFFVSIIIFPLATILFPYLPTEFQSVFELTNGKDFKERGTELRSAFESLGEKRKLVFVLLQFIQTFLAPIPGQLTAFLGGFLFGFWEGLFLTMLGVGIGVISAISFSRIFGIYLVKTLVPKKIISRFDYLLTNENIWAYFIIFLLPGMPDDAVCFVAGLTKIRVWKLVAVAVLGRLPGIIPLVFAGATSETSPIWTSIIVLLGAMIVLLSWFFDVELNRIAVRASESILNLLRNRFRM
ncbi:MAG TPA: hypothetical protein DIW23_10340 [Anaerolineae bacterium]|nr:hypothetical protein [Anaerolineae bacterium]